MELPLSWLWLRLDGRTEVGKIRRWMFPYFGFGYAWVKEGVLSLTLINSRN
jgi:hypothetical protein